MNYSAKVPIDYTIIEGEEIGPSRNHHKFFRYFNNLNIIKNVIAIQKTPSTTVTERLDFS